MSNRGMPDETYIFYRIQIVITSFLGTLVNQFLDDTLISLSHGFIISWFIAYSLHEIANKCTQKNFNVCDILRNSSRHSLSIPAFNIVNFLFDMIYHVCTIFHVDCVFISDLWAQKYDKKLFPFCLSNV